MSIHAAVNSFSDGLSPVDELDSVACKTCRDDHYSNFSRHESVMGCSLFEEDTAALVQLLQKIVVKVRHYGCETHSDEDTKFFEAIQNEGIELQKVTVFLWCLLEKAARSERSKEELIVGVAAANLYICLCGLKRAKLFHVFHINIFEKAIEVLRITDRLIKPIVSRLAPILNKKKREDQNNDPMDLGDSFSAELSRQIISALRSLLVFVHSKGAADIVFEKDGPGAQVIDLLRDVADLDMDLTTDFQAKTLDQCEDLRRASDASFAIVQSILMKESEKRANVIVSRFVMPRLLYWVSGQPKHMTGTIPNFLKDACQVMIHFLSTRFDNLTLSELRCIMKMLEAVPVKCSDRSEYRSSLAQNFADILAMMPPVAAHHIIDYVYILGKSVKTSHRFFALEIVPNLLRRFNFEQLHDKAEPIESMFMSETVDETVINAEENDDEGIVEGDAIEDNGGEEAMDQGGSSSEMEVDQEVDGEPEPRQPNNQPQEQQSNALHGMTARQAILDLLINGLVDKFAMQKALQAVEMLVSSNACVDDLAILSKKLVDDNFETLKLPGRAPPEAEAEVGNANASAMEVRVKAELDVSEANDFSTLMAAAPVSSHRLDDLLRLVIRACDSEKTLIAKHALSCLQSILCHAEVDRDIARKCIDKIREKCWDVAIQVRKQAALCLHRLLPVFPQDMDHAWLRGVLHQVVDNEQGVANQAIKLVSEYIVEGLRGEVPNSAWNLMDVVEGDTEYTRYLSICLTEQPLGSTRVTNVTDDFIRRLERVSEQPNCPPSAWMLLSELSPYMDVKPQCAEKVFDSLDFGNPDDRIPTYVAKIIANRCSKIPPARRVPLREKIANKINSNRVAVPHIAAVCYAYACLMDAVGRDDRQGAGEMLKFVKKYQEMAIMALYRDIVEPYRERVSSRNSATPFNSQPLETLSTKTDEFLRMIHSIGELVQYAPTAVNKRFVGILCIIVAGEEVAVEHHRQSQQFRPESVLTEGTQNTLPDTHISQLRRVLTIIPPGIRSAAVFAVGRICILQEKLANTFVQTLINLLTADHDHCVRNNILVVMGDICTTGGATGNFCGPILATAMRDKSVLVRRHAVSLITTLIRDEFFKWAGQIMYYYLGALVDPDDRVREQVHASLLNVLLPKFPTMFSNKFVETLFYFNDVIHPSMHVLLKQEQENCALALEDYFRLVGANNRAQRMKIYIFMISTFEDKVKIPLMGRIATEVFQCVIDQALDIDDPNVLHLIDDALGVLRCREIVLTMQTGKKSAADDVDEDNEEANTMQALASDFISNIYMHKLNRDVLHYLFKVRDYLKVKGCVNQAKSCHSTILDLFVCYQEHFDNLVGPDTQRREEIINDLLRYRNINIRQQERRNTHVQEG